uniref:Uncharacterized protein n=1 Tax=Aegilops tauschii subsp. strangulata TaxID=200361 RepID=A0A453NM35_AEGTS
MIHDLISGLGVFLCRCQTCFLVLRLVFDLIFVVLLFPPFPQELFCLLFLGVFILDLAFLGLNSTFGVKFEVPSLIFSPHQSICSRFD